jgi:hypothetical protein
VSKTKQKEDLVLMYVGLLCDGAALLSFFFTPVLVFPFVFFLPFSLSLYIHVCVFTFTRRRLRLLVGLLRFIVLPPVVVV